MKIHAPVLAGLGGRARRATQSSIPFAGAVVIAGVSFFATTIFEAAAEQETAKEIIAAQIRMQGFTCDRPDNAVRDQNLSKPNETVWVLTCEANTYRVTLIPDMAARVEQID